MTHINTSYAKPLFEALGEHLIYIRFVRHPMSTYMINHNINWTKRWETGGRHGHMLYKTKDQNSNSIKLPFCAKNFEKNYPNFSKNHIFPPYVGYKLDAAIYFF